MVGIDGVLLELVGERRDGDGHVRRKEEGLIAHRADRCRDRTGVGGRDDHGDIGLRARFGAGPTGGRGADGMTNVMPRL
jgi:hypothetical protein